MRAFIVLALFGSMAFAGPTFRYETGEERAELRSGKGREAEPQQDSEDLKDEEDLWGGKGMRAGYTQDDMNGWFVQGEVGEAINQDGEADAAKEVQLIKKVRGVLVPIGNSSRIET